MWGSDQIKQYDDNEICEYGGNDSDKMMMNEERYKQSKTDTPRCREVSSTVAGLEGTVTLLGSDPELDDISLFE